MLKDAESFAQHLEVEVTSTIPKFLIEASAVAIGSVISFFIICTISYMINDLVPDWHCNEGTLKSILLIVLELVITFGIFHQYFKLVKYVVGGVFPKDVGTTIYPELFSFVLMATAVYLFQESLLARTKSLWVNIFGDRVESATKACET